ncbi:Ferroxidase protein [Dioscorea alata]|uniref:Ferroxidase protein n=1 Tax=Dioscorea alata TaxID=55571 RepID=A0ACB7UP42_DIOAL|nr:Ferroxidase protein [Dioscorea alata]
MAFSSSASSARLLLRRLLMKRSRLSSYPQISTLREALSIGGQDGSFGPSLWSSSFSKFFSSSGTSPVGDSQSPAAIDYRSILEENEFHQLADDTIHDLQEKFEEYGDSVQIDGFDIDYGNQVLTVKLGNLGTYVVNKQTPNRQIWLSSPVSGPSRFDWDAKTNSWVYRRTKANLIKLLENEVEELCGKTIRLS